MVWAGPATSYELRVTSYELQCDQAFVIRNSQLPYTRLIVLLAQILRNCVNLEDGVEVEREEGF